MKDWQYDPAHDQGLRFRDQLNYVRREQGLPSLASSLAYFDAYRTADLPQNLIQAQRDAFGAHTYQRRDDADGDAHHSDWLE